ncbi:MAG TPA: gamma-glutamyl-gamma-aminobutyrate hydrolase family protein [Candidatus Limnocylindria bacterium]|nr:gamma-glutamyl-gamma-aminobutyrate hydrolase family protein [Candidatus Limnocylindria bacterium]
MRKLLVCQHVPHEILGTLNPMLKHAGFRIRYVNFGRHPDAQPNLDGYAGLIVLGGPMSAYDDQRLPHLAVEMKLIESAMKRNLPVLGICLGGQLVARTLGARVYANPIKEIGWYDVAPSAHADDDPLLNDFKERETLFQWHGDTFDIPHGGIHLASSRHCENQAFRFGANVYAFQFHLEVDEPMILRWLKVPENRREIASLHGDIDPDRIHTETVRHIGRLHELSDRVFGKFIENFGLEKSRRRLLSR